MAVEGAQESFKIDWSFHSRINGIMNVDSLTAVLSHIGILIVNLTKKNLNASVQEIKDVSGEF